MDTLLITGKKQKKRVEICKYNLKKIEEGKWRLCDIINGDESCFYFKKNC